MNKSTCHYKSNNILICTQWGFDIDDLLNHDHQHRSKDRNRSQHINPMFKHAYSCIKLLEVAQLEINNINLRQMVVKVYVFVLLFVGFLGFGGNYMCSSQLCFACMCRYNFPLKQNMLGFRVQPSYQLFKRQPTPCMI